MMRAYKNNARVRFWYTNYKGEHELRDATIEGVDYGENEWYVEPQWFLRTWDNERHDSRSFAFAQIEADTFEQIGEGRKEDN